MIDDVFVHIGAKKEDTQREPSAFIPNYYEKYIFIFYLYKRQIWCQIKFL